ncbi:MAG: beta-propeller domain-containing protein [Clostridia bacterium]|nr:beta-propeller domain-containing protein [Clostridia bacterium]
MKTRVFVRFTALLCLCFMFFFSSCGGGTDNNNSTGMETTVQEKGIDEGDIVKAYDGYIYKAQSDGVSVVKYDGPELTFVSGINISEVTPRELFVCGDKLALIASCGPYDRATAVFVLSLDENKIISHTPLYSAVFPADYVSSRLFKETGKLYVFTRCENLPAETDIGHTYTENGEEKESPYEDLDVDGYKTDAMKTNGYRSAPSYFLKIDLDDMRSTVTSYGNCYFYDVYVTENYVYGIFALCAYNSLTNKNNSCFILRTDAETLAENKLSALKDNEIGSRLSLKEHGEVLYAVSKNLVGGWCAVTSFDGDMNKISSLENIATGETLKSATFVKTETSLSCYIVTYRNKDPLFKIDVTDPENMAVTGELSVPGYSTLSHAFAGDLLVTVGYGGDEEKADTKTLKISLYHTGDEPTEISVYTIENLVSCEALDNIHAFCVDDERKIFAFSVKQRKDGTTRQGAYIFALDVKENAEDSEIKPLAYVTNFPNGYGSENWSVTYRLISRLLIDDEYAYSVSDAYVKSYSVADIESGSAEPLRSVFTGLGGLEEITL